MYAQYVTPTSIILFPFPVPRSYSQGETLLLRPNPILKRYGLCCTGITALRTRKKIVVTGFQRRMQQLSQVYRTCIASFTEILLCAHGRLALNNLEVGESASIWPHFAMQFTKPEKEENWKARASLGGY